MANEKYFLIIISLIFVIFLFTGIRMAGDAARENKINEPVRIGFIGPLSGELASWGVNEKEGVELAVKSINDAGGINGRLIEVIYEDGKCDPKTAATAAQKLINIDKVKFIIGETCSSATLAVAPIAEQNKIILISPTSGADSISQAGDFIFRVFIPNKAYGKAGAKIIEDKFGSKAVAVLYIQNDAGVSVKDDFINNYNGKIVLSEGYAPDTKDFKTLLLKVKEANPELVYLAGYYPDGGLILKQAKELDIKAQFFGCSDAYDSPELLQIAGDSAEGFMFITAGAKSGPGFKDFESKFKAKYGKEPPLFSDFAYDIANMLAQAIKSKGYDAEKVKDYLYQLKNYQGASNIINFDKNGDLVSSDMVMKIVQNSTIKDYAVVKGEYESEKPEKQTIKIGSIIPLTGGGAVYGEWTKKGFDLAVKQINALPDYPYHLELGYEDDEGTPKGAVSAFQKIINEYNTSIVIGFPLSKEAISVLPLAEESNVVLVSSGASSDSLRIAGDNFFRLRESGSLHGIATAEYLIGKGIRDNLGVLYVNAENGITYYDSFKTRFEELGGKIAFAEAYEEGETDFKTYLIKAKDKGVKTLYIPGVVADIGIMMKQAKELGLSMQFYSTPGAESSKLIEIAGEAAEGLIYTYPIFNPESFEPVVKDFVQNYEQEYGKTPEFIAANSYDVIKILAQVFKTNGISSEQIKNGLYAVKNYTGASGRLSIDEYGDVIKPIGFKTVKDGKFVVFDN